MQARKTACQEGGAIREIRGGNPLKRSKGSKGRSRGSGVARKSLSIGWFGLTKKTVVGKIDVPVGQTV